MARNPRLDPVQIDLAFDALVRELTPDQQIVLLGEELEEQEPKQPPKPVGHRMTDPQVEQETPDQRRVRFIHLMAASARIHPLQAKFAFDALVRELSDDQQIALVGAALEEPQPRRPPKPVGHWVTDPQDEHMWWYRPAAKPEAETG